MKTDFTKGDPLEGRVKEKHDRYDTLAETLNARFFPVVFDVYGAMHQEAISFMQTSAQLLRPSDRGSFVRELLKSVQVALIAGNAKIIWNALMRGDVYG
jgi:hypothetical protein